MPTAIIFAACIFFLVLGLGAWMESYNSHPWHQRATERVIAAFKDELAPYEVNKATK
jgi:hypothetical protein